MYPRFIVVLTTMNKGLGKRFRYVVSSIASAIGFAMFISLPFESRYFGLMAGVVLVVFCVWFGLGIIFSESLETRLLTILLPTMLFGGFGMFGSLIADSWWMVLLLSGVFGLVMYGMFLVENVFLVAIGFKTVPLYRAAYTVSLILLLVSSFFMYDSMFSFRLSFVWNSLISFLMALVVFAYQFWAVAIELPDDGKSLNRRAYILIPALLVAELTFVLSFWPAGIFKWSIYLVSAIYILCGLIQADIRERLFARTQLTYLWISLAVLTAIFLVTRWN